jgi:hypothetical protein
MVCSSENDKLAVAHDGPITPQISAAYELVEQEFFCIEILGGHGNFLGCTIQAGSYLGAYGMILADMLRRDMGLSAP